MQHLGRADAVEDLYAARALGPSLPQLLRQRLARGGADPELESRMVREVGRGKERGIERGDAVEDRRLPFDQPLEHRVGRRALGHQDRRRADRQRKGQRVTQAVGEEELRGREHDVGFADAEDGLAVELGGGDEVRVEMHRALRRSGRARRVEPEAHVVAGGRSRVGRRVFPHEQLFELGKTLGSEHRAPFPFDVAEDVVGLCVCGASALGKTDNACAALVGRVGPDEIAATFEAPEELVHGLFAHPGALSEQAGANAIRTGKLQHRHVRHAQLFEPGRVELRDDPALNGLSRHAQQRADEHVLRFDRRADRRRRC